MPRIKKEVFPPPEVYQVLALERNLVHLQTDLELTKRDLAKKRGVLDAWRESTDPRLGVAGF